MYVYYPVLDYFHSHKPLSSTSTTHTDSFLHAQVVWAYSLYPAL